LEPSLNQSALDESWSGAAADDRRNRVLSLLDGSIFYGVIAVIAITAIPYGTVDSWSESLFECAVFFLTLLWIVHGFIQGSWRIGNLRLLLPVIGLVLLAVGQSIAWAKTDLAGEKVWITLSADPFETWAFAFRMAALVLAALLVIRFTSNTRRLGILVHAIIVIAVMTALFGIGRQTMQHGQGFGLSRLPFEYGYAQFINKNHFAFLMEMALGLVVGVALMQNGRHDRVLLYVAILLLLSAAIVLSGSRGGLLSIMVQVILAALLLVNSRMFGREQGKGQSIWSRWARSITVTAVTIGALLLITIAGVIWLGGDQLATGFETTAGEMISVDRTELHEGTRRRDIWRASWLMFKAHPITGAGLGGYWAEVPLYHSGSGVMTPQQAHNDYLELIASGGILGAGLFGWFTFALIRQSRTSIRNSQGFQRAVMLGAIISIVGVGVHSLADFGLHITINALVFMILLAMLSVKTMNESTGREFSRTGYDREG